MKRKLLSGLLALVLVLSFSLVTAVPVGAIDSSTLQVIPFGLEDKDDADAKAEWDAQDGDIAVHLTTGPKELEPPWGDGDTATIVINASDVGITILADVASISWEDTSVGYPAHVDIMIDTDGDEVVDDALVIEYAYNTGSHPLVSDSTNAWLTSRDPGPLGADPDVFAYHTLGEWKAGITVAELGEWISKTIDGSTSVIALEIEVDNWIEASESYIDNIEINDVVYYGSIQDAIDSASPNDTINVAAGTYREYLHITTDGLTIEGAGIDQSIIDLDGLTPYWHYPGNKSFASRAGVLITGYGSTDEIIEDVTFRGFTVKNAGLNPPITATGTHTGLDNAAVLTDSSALWTPSALVGQWVHNYGDRDTDYDPARSYGLITANTATTVTATLSGGMNADWDAGDQYVITSYEHFYDQYFDGHEDIRGISIANGKNILIQNNKVINSGYGGITVGKARLVNTHKYSEGVTIDSNISSDHPVAGIGIGGVNDYVGPVTITNNILENNKRPHLADPTREYSGYGIRVKGKSSSETLSGVISGNTIRNNGFEGIIVANYTDGVIVEDNIVTGHNFDQDGAGIFLYHWGHPEWNKNHIVRNNSVTGNIRGIVAYYVSNSVIEGNTITTDSGTFPLGQAAIKLDNSHNIVVKDNTISSGEGVGIRITSIDSYDNTFTGNTINGAMFAGVYITSDAHDNTFTSNEITGTTSGTFTQYADWGNHNGGSDQAVLTDSMKSWTPDAFVGFTLINTTDGSEGTITANTATIVTATLSGGTDNDWDTGDEYDITFEETQADGVFLRGGNCKDSLHAGTGNVFHDNDIYGNAGDGMENQTTTTADATSNWWGTTGEVEIRVMLSVNVTYSPWLAATKDTTPMAFIVDDVGPEPAAGYIQAAIDSASPNDTVLVSPGTYDEQVVIDKALTLQGAGDTTIIQPSAANILTHIVVTPWIAGTKNFAGIIAIYSVEAAVTVKDLKVDGINVDSAPSGSNWVAGIVYNESPGTIDGVTVVNMEMPTSDRTNGIWMSAVTATVSVEVMNSTVNNYNRGGIYAFGSTLTVNIHDNTVIGPGTLAANNVPNGIMLLNGVQGTVGPNNTVSNHIYTPPTYAATGIALWDVNGVTVEGNSVTNCELGIALTGYTGSAGNTIQDNTVNGNPRAGIFMETPGTINNEITGNTITNNAHGIEVMGSLSPTYDSGEEAGPDNVAQFNNITGNTQYGVVNFNPDITFDATNNWWGDPSGPYHATANSEGTGDAVSDNVDFAPWLYPPTVVTNGASSRRTTSATLNGTLNDLGSASSVTVFFEWGTTTAAYGTPVLVVTPLSEAGVFSLIISGLSPSTTYYFRAKAVGDGPDAYGDDVTFTTRAVAVWVPPPAIPHGTTDVRGQVSDVGVFLEPITAISEDELLTLTIPEGTVGLTEELEPIDEITVVIMDEPPDPPEDAHVIGLTYDLGPDGATFDPPIALTFSYDPADLPEGVAEEDLVLAYYNEATGEWVELVGVVDTENNTITASVPHFTTFAVIGTVPAPALPLPLPPEEEEVPTVVTVEEEEEEPEVVITVTPSPAAFSVSYLSVNPRLEVEAGETVTITVLVANTGGESGSYTAVLKIDGVKEAEETVTIAAGEGQDVSFNITREEASSYTVAVDGLSGSFTVVAPPEEEEEEEELPIEPPALNWPLIGGIIGGVIVVAALGVFFWRRRRAY